jgi:hypothetical protein
LAPYTITNNIKSEVALKWTWIGVGFARILTNYRDVTDNCVADNHLFLSVRVIIHLSNVLVSIM